MFDFSILRLVADMVMMRELYTVPGGQPPVSSYIQLQIQVSSDRQRKIHISYIQLRFGSAHIYSYRSTGKLIYDMYRDHISTEETNQLMYPATGTGQVLYPAATDILPAKNV